MELYGELSSAFAGFTEALLESPLLLVFALPWTLSALLALCYVEGGLFVSMLRIHTVLELFANLIGFGIALPWLLLAGMSAGSIASALARICLKNRGLWISCMEFRMALDLWIPKKGVDQAKMLGVVIAWSIASLPFILLVAKLFEHSKVSVALFLGLLLLPYWSLAFAGIYLCILGWLRQCRKKSFNSEQIQLQPINNTDPRVRS